MDQTDQRGTSEVVSLLDPSPQRSVELVESHGAKRQSAPKRDAYINGFPHLVREVISDQDQSGRNRVLPQAACLARFGNALRREEDMARSSIVSAIYIDDELRARWHLVYQLKIFDLTNAKGTLGYVFRLYNFVSRVNEDNVTLRDIFHDADTLSRASTPVAPSAVNPEAPME